MHLKCRWIVLNIGPNTPCDFLIKKLRQKLIQKQIDNFCIRSSYGTFRKKRFIGTFPPLSRNDICPHSNISSQGLPFLFLRFVLPIFAFSTSYAATICVFQPSRALISITIQLMNPCSIITAYKLNLTKIWQNIVFLSLQRYCFHVNDGYFVKYCLRDALELIFCPVK